MAEFTKERLEEIKQCNVAFGRLATLDEVVIMADALLAIMDKEPVAYYFPGGEREIEQVSLPDDLDDGQKANCIPLYAAPQLPQPAVPEKAITQHFDTIALDVAKMVMCDVNRRNEFLGGDVQLLSRIQCRIDEACRSAMLQGADQPQNAQQNIPENIPTLREGVAAIRGLGPIDAGKIQAERDALNEPDVQDGYALVPVDMAPEQMRAVQINSELGAYAAANLSGAYSLFREFWDVAVKSAPNQEAK